MANRDDEHRIFEHFVIAGLDKSSLEQLSPSSQECGCRNIQPLAPITDICVIFPSLGETMPEGFEIISTTPLGYPADLNHGSIRIPSVFIGFRRGYHKPPIVDIGILDLGRGEKAMVDTNVLQTTPFGRPANVNNAAQGIFLTYRRAHQNSTPSQFVVTNIVVLLANKGEVPPHTYYKISKNLNKGMVGSDVYICYKKTQGTSKRLAYKPTVLDSFPLRVNEDEQFRLAQNVPLFCLPMGAVIECWPSNCQAPERSFTTFVLTDENGTKFYGAAVSFYEKYTDKLTDEQLEQLELTPGDSLGGVADDSSSNNDPADQIEFHTNIAICLISRYPFFHSFKRFLYYIHRISQRLTETTVPIERYLSHLRYEVSFPTPRRPMVVVELGNETISFESQDDCQLPLNGAQLYETLRSLGSENLMYLMLLALLEQKILVHSLRSWMLTAVAESIRALMFPFHWQCPYVPQCPLGLAGVLHAPLPFIAGVDSRYFELYEDPPEDVTCFDLDTCTISGSKVRHSIKLSMLPKKATKQLRNTLDELYRKICTKPAGVNKRSDFLPLDEEQQIHRRRKEIETEIQDAFLRFTANLMKGYQAHLRPIKSASATVNATDTGNLFNVEEFIKSRDKTSEPFFRRFCETQSFIRFIEERSFVSDKNTFNAFFDDCINKIIDETQVVPLLEADTSSSEKHPNVFIAPPEPFLDPETGKERLFKYSGFPRQLNTDLFQLDTLNVNEKNESEKVPMQHEQARCSAVRTKPEARSSNLAGTSAVRSNPLHWPKILLFYSYSLWFMQLPSLISVAPNKKKILRLAFHVLDRIEQSGIQLLDQVCYRILIELCGEYEEPMMAVKVLHAMHRAGVEQNAVTYGIYHRAVINAQWPSEARQKAIHAWGKLRLVLLAVRHLKKDRMVCIAQARKTSVDGQSLKSIETALDSVENVPYTISYEPLDKLDGEGSIELNDETGSTTQNISDPLSGTSDKDPLGALSSKAEEEKAVQATMSPSRAKFLAEHASTPFANDETPKSTSKTGRSGSWFKGITSSPMLMKIMRSQTFESPKSLDGASAESSSLSVSPSLHAIVSHVKRGYDDVIKEGVSSKFKLGVSSLVHEVRSLNSSSLFGDDHTEVAQNDVDVADPAFQLDSGISGALLSENWWLSEVYLQMKRQEERTKAKDSNKSPILTSDVPIDILEVTLCTSSACSMCKRIVYDEEIMGGWKVDDQNMNTTCPYCYEKDPGNSEFAPRLSIEFVWKTSPEGSWYQPGGLKADVESNLESPTAHKIDSMSVAFVSPLVLRRELETLLASDIQALKNKDLMNSHPVVFWNFVYYMRRLNLPSHMFNWIAPRHHVRCVYDRPWQHTDITPLYFANSNHRFGEGKVNARTNEVWQNVVKSVQENKLFSALQILINNYRVTQNGRVIIAAHFPVFRDVLFASLDYFGRGLLRDNLDVQYPHEFEHLPVRIRNLLPFYDLPQKPVLRACRKIFMPLDLI
ncbi:unnamed protein product [Auanema sp. JU1783]|nr:unnamed protein product [Auanema sp. JU1783]